jgi:hypothetical protein
LLYHLQKLIELTGYGIKGSLEIIKEEEWDQTKNILQHLPRW